MGNSNHDVRINVTFRNLDPSDAVRDYASDKVSSTIKKFVHQNVEANVVLRVEKTRHITEIIFHADGADFNVTEESEDMYSAIDISIDALGRQLRRNKEKMVAHH